MINNLIKYFKAVIREETDRQNRLFRLLDGLWENQNWLKDEIENIEVTAGGRGDDGDDGDDGAGLELIFALYTEPALPTSLRPQNTWGYREPDDVTATISGSSVTVTWVSTLPEVTEAKPHLFASQRDIEGSPDVGDEVTDDWSTPVRLSKFALDGIPGADGVDGQGIEYIFAAYNSATLPTGLRPDNAWGYDEGGTANAGGVHPSLSGETLTWYDGAPDIDATTPYLYRSSRKVPGKPSTGTAVTDTWTEPKIVGRYGPAGAAGARGVAGADGEDAAGIEYIFAIYSAATLPANFMPDNAWGYDSPGMAGSHTTVVPSTRDITVASANANAGYLWSDDTTLWVADRTKMYAYTLADGSRDSAKDITLDTEQGEVSGLWGDGTTLWAADYSDAKLYAYSLSAYNRDSSKDKTNLNRRIRGFWSDGTTFWLGSLGGRSLEAYTLSNASRDSAKDITLDSENTNITGIWGDGTTIWVNDYNDQKAYAYTISDGSRQSGKDIPLTAETHNSNGLWSDGTLVWTTHQTFPAPRNIRAYALADGSRTTATYFSSATLQWHDGAPNLTETNPYLYRAQRKIEGSPDAGDPVADGWSSPTIVGRYGLDGGQGLRGIAGSDGSDGEGVEYIFAKYDSATFPSGLRPKNTWGYESPTDVTATISGSSVTITWEDGAPNIDDTNPYLYRCQRKIAGSPAVGASISANWTEPRIVGRYGPAGAAGAAGPAGAAGEDAAGYEYVFAIYSDASLPSLLNPKDTWGYDDPKTGGDAVDITTLFNGRKVNPLGLWGDGTTLWTLNQATWTIDAHNRSDGSIDTTKSISLATKNRRNPSCLWSDGTTIWVPSTRYRDPVTRVDTPQTIYAYTLLTRTRDSSKDIVLDTENQNPSGIWGDGNIIWVSDSRDAKLYAYHISSKTRNTSKDITRDSSLSGTIDVIAGDGTTIWVDNGERKLEAYTISTKARDSSKDISIDFDTTFRDVIRGLWINSGRVYLINRLTREVVSYTISTKEKRFLVWHDGAPNLTADNPYLFRCDRKIQGNPSQGDAVTDTWSTPAVVGRWGDTGVAGKGFEYIYTAFTSNSLPTAKNPSNDWLYNRGGTADGQTWSITSPSLSSTNQYLFRAEREVLGGTVDGDVVADHWSSPIVVGRWGTVGAGGKGTEFIYTAYSSRTLPSDRRPDNAWRYEAGGTTTSGQVWTDDIPALTTANRYMFVSKRTIEGSPSAGDAVTDTWSVPSLYTYLAQDGADGAQGIYQIRIYRAVTTGSAAPATPTGGDKDNAPTGWSFSTPSFSGNDVYCSSATYNPATLTLSTWDTPFQLGAEGARGATGPAGAAGQGIEYLWAVNNAATIRSADRPSNSWGYKSGGTAGGLTWSTTALATTTSNKYLWQVSRAVTGSPAVGDSVTASWTSPVRISSYGDTGPQGPQGTPGSPGIRGADGVDGEDADGWEYVFAKYSSETFPSGLNPSNTWGYDSAGDVTSGGITVTWSDGAPSLTTADKYLYRSQRKIQGSPSVGDTVSANWSTPVIVGRYGADGVAGADGTDGEDGRGKEYVFAVYNSETLPSGLRPDNDWTYDSPGDVTATVSGSSVTLTWSDGAQNVTSTNRWLFRAERDIEGLPSTGDTVSTAWSIPRIVGAYGNTGPAGRDGTDGARGPAGRDGRDGSSGTDGTDGIGLEVAWASYTGETLITSLWPLDTWTYKTYAQRINPSDSADTITWSSTPPSLSSARKYLWRAQRTIQGNPSRGATINNSWTAPAIESRWGDDGAAGNTGPQGPAGNTGPAGAAGTGREIIFTLTTSASLPNNRRPDNSWGYDEGGTRNGQEWHDAAPSLSSTDKYLWACERKVVGTPAQGDSVAANWEDPYITGRWGDDGATGPAGAAGTPGRDGTDGSQGAQGRYHINIYRRVADSAGTPATPTGGDKDTAPTNWSFNLPAQRNNQTIWQSFATYDPATSTLTTWSSPYEIGSEGPTGPAGPAGTPGRDGAPGADGTDGADGKGREVIYAAYNSSNLPAGLRPDNAWGYDEGGTATSGSNSLTWHDANPGLTETNSYLFTAERTIIGSPSTGASVSDTWSVPKVAGRYGPRGVAGADGQDGAGYEFIFAKYNAVTLPSRLNPKDTWGYDSPGLITGESSQTLTFIGRFIYASTDSWTLEPDDNSRSGVTNPDLLPSGSPTRLLSRLRLWKETGNVGRMTLYFAETQTEPVPAAHTGTQNMHDLSDIFESRGEVIITQGANTITIPMGGADTVEPYNVANLSRAKQDEIRAWVTRQDGSTTATVKLSVTTGGSLQWHDAAPSLDSANRWLFRAQRAVSGAPTAGASVSDNWTTPRVVGYYAVDGAAGARGDDGAGTEFVYCKYRHSSLPAKYNPSNAWGYDQPGVSSATEFSLSSASASSMTATGTHIYLQHLRDTAIRVYDFTTKARASSLDITLDTLNGNPIGIWTNGTTIYVSDNIDNRIYAYTVSSKSRDRAKEILLHSDNANPADIWSNGTTLYVLDEDDSKLYAYTLSSGGRDASKEITLHSDHGLPTSVTGVGTTIYVGDSVDRKFYAYDTDTRAHVPGDDLPVDRIPSGGAFISGGFIYSASGSDTLIHTFSLTTGHRDRVEWHDAVPDATREEPYTFVSQRAVSGTPTAGDSVSAGWTTPKLLATFGVDGFGTEEIFAAYQSETLPTYLYPVNAWGYDAPGTAPDIFNLHTTNTHARGIWGNGTTLWVVDSDQTKLFAYTIATLARDSAKDIDLHSENGHPEDIWGDDTRIWVVDSHARKVYCYRISDGARRTGRELNLSSFGNYPFSIWSDKSTIWVSAPGGQLRAFNYSNGSRAASRDINLGFTPNRGMWSDGNTLWVMPSSGTHVRAYTKGTNTRVASEEFNIDVAQSLAWGMWGTGNLIYISDFQDGWVYVYDKTTKEVDGLDWQDNSPALTEDKPYIFRSVRTIRGQPAVGSAVAGDWDTPTVWARQPTDGIAGEAGAGTETIYRLSDQTPLPTNDYPSNSWGYLTYENQWAAERMETTEENRYRYSSTRKIIGQPVINSQQDEDWSTPVLDGQWQSDFSIPDISVFWPFEHGLRYDTRKTSAPETSGGGHWQATGWATGTKFDDVTQLCFSIRDEDGINRHAVFASPTFDHQRWIGIGYTDGDGNHHHAGFRMTGKRTITNGSGGNPIYACFPVARYTGIDGGTPSSINPPADSEYDIYLLLPHVTTSTGRLTSRAPGWFQYEVSAIVATAMEGLANPLTTEWTGIIADAAEEATLGESLIGDVVTLYRGSITQTRIYSGTAWIAATERIDGTLFVSGLILTRHMATDAVTARIIAAEQIEAEHVKANSLTGDKFIAQTIEADKLLLGDWFEATSDGKLILKVNSYDQYRSRQLNTAETYDEEVILAAGISHPRGVALTRTRMYVLDSDNTAGSAKAIFSFNRQTKEHISSEKITLHADNANPEGLWTDETIICTLDNIDNKVYAYTISSKSRNTSKDINLHADNRHFKDLWSDDDYMWVTDSEERQLYCYNYDNTKSTFGDRVQSKEITLTQNNENPVGLWGDGLHFYVLDSTDKRVYAYQTLTDEGVKDSPFGMWSDGTHMWVVDKYHHAAYAHHLETGARDSTKDIDLHANNTNPVDLWGNSTHLYVLDDLGNKIYAYKFSNGNRDTSKEISISSGYLGLSITGSGNTLWTVGSAHYDQYSSDARTLGVYVLLRAYSLTTRNRLTSKDLRLTIGGSSANERGSHIEHDGFWRSTAGGDDPIWDAFDSVNDANALVAFEKITKKTIKIDADGDYMYMQYFGPEVRRADGAGGNLEIVEETRFLVSIARTVRYTQTSRFGSITYWVEEHNYSSYEVNNNITPYFRSVAKWKLNPTSGTYDDLPIDGSYISGLKKDYDMIDQPTGLWVDSNYVYAGYSTGTPYGQVKTFDKTTGNHVPEKYVDLFVALGWGVYDQRASFDLHRNNQNPIGIASDGTDFWVGDWANLRQSLYSYFYNEKRYLIDEEIVIEAGHRNPYGICMKEDVYWVSDVYDNLLRAFTRSTKQRNSGRDIRLNGFNGRFRWDIWCNDDTVWVVDSSNRKLWAWSVAFDSTFGNRQATKDITLHSSNTEARGVWSDGNIIWVSDYAKHHIYAYRLSNGSRVKNEEIDTDAPEGMWGNSEYIYVAHLTHTRLCAFDKKTKVRNHEREWHQLYAANARHVGGIWGEGSLLEENLTFLAVNRTRHVISVFGIDKRAAPVLTVDEDGVNVGVLNADVVNTGILNVARIPDPVVHLNRKLYPKIKGRGNITVRTSTSAGGRQGTSQGYYYGTSANIELADTIFTYAFLSIHLEAPSQERRSLTIPVDMVNTLSWMQTQGERIYISSNTTGYIITITMRSYIGQSPANDQTFIVKEIYGYGREDYV